jgi:transposase InsO family protein
MVRWPWRSRCAAATLLGWSLHTDRGSEYTARRFHAAYARLGIAQSMGRPGSALDNSVIEAWHSTLEFELHSLERFPGKAAARARVAAWVDEYNRTRRHSSMGMISPVDYELAHHNDPDTEHPEVA